MAWEPRENGRLYYYRARKVRGRVVRRCMGSGRQAQEAAREDACQRAVRQAQRQAVVHKRDGWKQLDATVRDAAGVIDLLARANLFAAGYHQHDRGSWRLRRHVPAA